MNRNRAILSTILILFLVYGLNARASESYFAQDFIRSLFSISIEKPIVHTFKNPNTPLTKGKDQVPQKVSLLVWNIHKGESIKNKKLPFSLNAYDFVFIQENMWRWSLEGLPFNGHHYFIPTFSIDNDKTGVSLLSQYEAKRFMGLHSNYYEPFIISPKSYLVLEFDRIALINVHALNFVTFEEWKAEIDRISEKAKKYIEDKSGLIIAGDFNTWNEERFNYLRTKFTNIGLQEITYKKDLRTKTFGFPIDYVFSHGFRLRDSNVFAVEEFSDHNALEVVLEIKPFN